MAYSRDYPNSIIPKGSKVVECLQNDDKELKRILGMLSDIGVMSLFGSKRQCVLHAATGTDGKPSYITAKGLNVAINGSTTPVIVTFAGGYNANGTVDKTDTIVDTVNAWTMPANGTYYLYIDKDMSTGILSYGHTTIPDTYATTAPESPTLDQCYFNTVDMKMYHYNSSAWEQKLRVFVAKAVTTADTTTLTIYPFTSRTTASNFIQYDGNGNLQAVDLAGALTQFSASKFIGTFKGDIVGNADTATKAIQDKNGADIAATYLPKSGGTMSGNLTVPALHGNADSATHADNATHADTADNANKLGGYSLAPIGVGRTFGSIPLISPNDGVMEIGKYLDWHATNGDVDNTSRFTAEDNGTVTVGTINGTLHGTADEATHAASATTVSTIAPTGQTKDLVFAYMAGSDYFRILVGDNGNDNGYVSFDVADNGNEPIYFRQYTGSFTTVTRQVTLLDGDGNTSFPGTVSAPTFSGHLAGTADNANAVNGWNVDSFKRNLGGRNQPTLTSILDGCYDGNGNKFNKVVNASTGISGYGTGDIHLTQSYKNFDKILVVLSNDNTNTEDYALWDTWQLAYAFSHGWCFGLDNGVMSGSLWHVYTAVKAGTQTHPLSTDTIWYCCNESSVMVDIIGVNY